MSRYSPSYVEYRLTQILRERVLEEMSFLQISNIGLIEDKVPDEEAMETDNDVATPNVPSQRDSYLDSTSKHDGSDVSMQNTSPNVDNAEPITDENTPKPRSSNKSGDISQTRSSTFEESDDITQAKTSVLQESDEISLAQPSASKESDDTSEAKSMVLMESDEILQVKPSTSKDSDEISQVKPSISKDSDEISQVKPNTSKDSDEISQVKPNTSKDSDETSQVKPNTSKDSDEISQVKPSTSKDSDEISQVKPNTSKDSDEISQVKPNTSKDSDEISQVKPSTSKESDDISQEKPSKSHKSNKANQKSVDSSCAKSTNSDSDSDSSMMSDFSPRPPPGRYDNTPLSETFDMKTTDGEKVKSPYLFNDKKHALNLVEGLHGLQKEGKLTDTIVSIDGKEFRCHAVILLASAESWKIRLSSASEEKDGTKKIVLDEDIDATTFNHVLNFIYSGKIEATENSLYRLKDAADTLEIPMLSDYSEKVIKQEKDEREMKSKIPDNLPDEIRIYIFHQRQSEALKEEKARVAAVSMEIMKKLHEMQQEKTNTDVELKVNNELIEAHRVLLAACSPYFTAMFTSNMKESLERVVEVRNIDDSIMEKLIKYMYTGEIEMDENDSQSMLETSCLLQILPILEATGRFLANHLDPINCFSMKQYGQIHCCQSLETAADIYILEHFDDIAQQSDFLKIGLDEFTTYLKMNVCVEKEDIIYDCLMRYIRYDLENRKDSLSEMLKMIRWPFISQTFLNEKVKNDPLIVDCDELFDEAAKYHNSSIQERYGIRQKHSWSHPRSYSQVVAVICGFRTPRNVRNVQSFDPDSNKWQPIVDLPDPTFDDIVSAVKIGTDIMLFTLKGNAWLYNSSQRRWLQMKCPKNVNRFFYGAASLNDNVYLVGGKNLEGTVYKSVERYNPVTNDWDNIPEMPTGVHYPAVTSHAGELYVIGGHTAKYHSPSGAVQIFNPDTNIWRRGADIPILTFIANALSIHEYVYVVSGEYGRMQRYSPRNDRWEEAATLDQRHYLGTITVCNNKIYAIGGYSDFSHSERNISNSIECYDPQKNTWKTVSEMPTPVPWHMSVALPRCVVECHNCV